MTDPKPQLTPERVDAISLEQALRDFEAANARVLDLTQRLLASERHRQELSDQMERFQLLGSAPSAANVSMLGRVGLIAGETATKVLKKAYRKLKP
jgi:hypothetical protein